MLRVVNLQYPNIQMKANSKQNAVKLDASKIGSHVMVRVVTKYGKQCLHQVVSFVPLDLKGLTVSLGANL